MMSGVRLSSITLATTSSTLAQKNLTRSSIGWNVRSLGGAAGVPKGIIPVLWCQNCFGAATKSRRETLTFQSAGISRSLASSDTVSAEYWP